MGFTRDDMDRFCRYIEYMNDGVVVEGIEYVEAIPSDIPANLFIMRSELDDGRVLAMIKPDDKLIITEQPQGA